MSLPPSFLNPQDYFEEALKFLERYQNLYKYANTKILSYDVLNFINTEGFENIDIDDEKFKLNAQNSQIEEFQRSIERLKVDYRLENVVQEKKLKAPLGAKKKHEIFYLASEIEYLCQMAECDTVVDFGSGLGYLDQLLFDTCNYNVLGIECNSKHYVSAKTRQKKYHDDSKTQVKYVKHTINDESSIFIESYLNEKFGCRPFCITGLHACADLPINALNLFLKMADARAMVLMSCCYHRMVGNDGSFTNFPLSESFSKVFSKLRSSDYVNVPFLRLAAQPPRPADGLKDLVFNLMARATLELYADRHNITLSRKKRRAVNVKNTNHDFEAYAQSAIDTGFTFSCKNCCANDDETLAKKCKCKIVIDLVELNQLWDHYSQGFTQKRAAIFILLQRMLQPLCENLVLYDRIVYLKERGVMSCAVKKIVDECISPRCLAIIACK